MYVNRMRLLNVKSLNQDIPEGGGPLPEYARRRLLLLGGNGSGKSTVLETILALWQFWGEWIEEGEGDYPYLRRDRMSHFLAEATVAAVEIVGIPNTPPLWIVVGQRAEWLALKNTYPEALVASLTSLMADVGVVHLPAEVDFLTRRHRSLAGAELFPNIVYFPSEGRTLLPPESPRAEIIDMTPFNWAAVYDSTLSLDSILLTVQALNPERFEECLKLVNLALQFRQKRITGFGPKGRLIVEGKTASGDVYQHPIEELSSGERQFLLLVGFVVAFLRPGGIVLLDEPDLHIHFGMLDQLMETMEGVVRERNGQLIVASQAERICEWFTREEEHVDLTPWRGVKI